MREKILTLPLGSLATDLSSITVSVSRSQESRDHQSASTEDAISKKIRIEMPEAVDRSIRQNFMFSMALGAVVILITVCVSFLFYRDGVSQYQVSRMMAYLDSFKGLPVSFENLKSQCENLKTDIASLQKKLDLLEQDSSTKRKYLESSIVARQEKMIDAQLRISHRIQKVDAQIQRIFWLLSQQNKEMESLKLGNDEMKVSKQPRD